jgi:hypothetical protein
VTIASGIANSGSLPWTVSGPATNDAWLKVVAHDAENNTGSDISDTSFSIIDGATSTLLATFVANPVDAGMELRWQLGDPNQFAQISVDRATASTGPWTALAVTPSRDGDQYVAVDGAVESGQTYWYRLNGVTTRGASLALGTITGTAGKPVTEFAISKVSPNPSPGPTAIEFTVPRMANVKVSVLDVVGREVAQLASGPHPAGRYNVMWSGDLNGKRAPSGMYFIRLQAPGVRATRRAIITR